MNLVPWLILLPLVAGVAAYALRGAGARAAIVIATGAALSAVSVLLLAQGGLEYSPGPILGVDWGMVVTVADFALLVTFLYFGWKRRSALVLAFSLLQIVPMAWLELIERPHSEVEPVFFADWLSIAMVLIVSVVGSLICVYALRYMVDHEEHGHVTPSRQPRFFLLLLVFLGAMNGLVLANHLLWLYFFWEVTTLCSFLLIAHDGTDEAWANATRALWMNSLGGAAFVGAIVLTHLQGSSFSVQALVRGGEPAGIMLLPLSLLVLAGFTKAAQMPFQGWLLGAMVAPTPVSALLHSSTMVKAGVYLVMRLAPTYEGTPLSTIVAVAGGFTFVATAALAISQTNAKRVLAYSTVSNLGLIIACAGLNTPPALAAAVLLTIFHAISKALLFLSVGTIEHQIWSRQIEDMEGLMDRMPLTASITLVGILTMLLPPFGVLIAKWAAVEAATHLPIVLLLVVLGSALTMVFWTKWMGRLLSGGAYVEGRRSESLSALYAMPLLALVGGAVVLSGLVGVVADRLSGPAVSLYYGSSGLALRGEQLAGPLGAFPTWPLFVAIALTMLAPILLTRVKTREVRPIYACGEQVEVEGRVAFRSVGDAPQELSVGSYYFDTIFGEGRLNRWLMPVAIALLLALLGVVYL